MNKFDGFKAGVNLGGWISQYREAKKEHFDSFITEADIELIAGWGMDHVRLPIDYMVLEDDDRPFEYRRRASLILIIVSTGVKSVILILF